MTEQEKQELLNAIKAESTDVTGLPVAETLDNVSSLPALRGTELVSVPITQLAKPALDAAKEVGAAVAQANEAAGKANTAAQNADTQASAAQTAAGKADTAAANAKSTAEAAAGRADAAAKRADDAVANLGEATGSGSGFYNVTQEHPLASGYYTKQAAVAALAGAGIKDEEKPGMILTFEKSAGKWADYRFTGTALSTFTDPGAWEEYGGAGAVKQITVRKGTATDTLTPDEQGGVELEIPEVAIDTTIDENSTNPVENKAVAAKFREMGGKYGASLQLNTIGEGAEKAYSLSLLDENGEVLNTSDMFTGGGGGSVATTKIVLTRITANPTVKMGDEVKLTYKYDHTDTSTGESTGNAGHAVISVTHGANTSTMEQTVAAGSTNTVDVTPYLGVGSNTVKVRVTTGEGDEMQVSQITWTVQVVQLTLSSTFNPATAITRGDTVTIPYALSGSGQKTLRCYVDGTDTDDRSITASTANGSFSIPTASLRHGSHTVQLVVELELAGGSVIKSNSILHLIGVREPGNTQAVISARFDYADGTVIAEGAKPYIEVKQYDKYTLAYAAYNPKETPTRVDIYVGGTLFSSALVPFATRYLEARALEGGRKECRIVCGTSSFHYDMHVLPSDLNVTEPTDNLRLKLTAQGRSNADTNREEWSYNGVQTVFEGFKWGGDGWTGSTLRLTDQARATVQYQPLKQPDQNVTGSFSYVVKYKASEVVDEDADLIRCVDTDGTGFVITPTEARMTTRGKSTLSMKMAAGEVYEVAFTSFPKESAGSSDYEKTNSEMVYLYINGIMSGCVQRASGDSVYQSTPQHITLGSAGATLDVYLMRAYDSYLSDSQVLDCYLVDQESADELIRLYDANNVIDENGNVTVDNVPVGMRYIIITGRQANGVPTVLQAAVNNNKKTKFDVDEMLCVCKGREDLNFLLVGGCISLQGTSSLAYPIKNYRIYLRDSNKKDGQLYLGCNAQGIGGTLQAKAKYSFKLEKDGKRPSPVNCFCLKADYAESSSSHNTGLARIANDVLVQCGQLTPAQKHVESGHPYEVRTTVDGEPCYLFYRGTKEETPQFLGKFNWNNDKSTEEVFGFVNIPGYNKVMLNYGDFVEIIIPEGQTLEEAAASTDRSGWDTATPYVFTEANGKNHRVEMYLDGNWKVAQNEVNPVECWEFLNNDFPMGVFRDDDFDKKEPDGTPSWMKVFEARYPDDDDNNAAYEEGSKKPYYLQRLVKWVKSTLGNPEKFKAGVGEYFDTGYLCDYYTFTDIFGCVDQRVKNMMFGFWLEPESGKVLCYPIFYDCDTILGVRNDGRLKYHWDIDEESIDPELSTADKTVYAYAGHDSILWANLRTMTAGLQESYRRLRAKMSNAYIFQVFDDEQSGKFCERIYNLDALNKYVTPKTRGVEVNQDGVVSVVKYSYLESMQGSRKAHRHWWLTNRLGLFDARYSTGQYSQTDITFKGNSEAGATVKATPSRDFYFEFRREGETMVHVPVKEDAEWSYTYDQMANIGTIFHLFGGQWMKKLDLSGWGGFTDLQLPYLPVLEELTLGTLAKTYALTELVLGTKLPMMRKLMMRNYVNLPSVDVSGCNRLEELDASGCLKLSTISFAEGATLKKLRLPVNFQTLTLRSMQYLSWTAITFDGKRNLTGLWVENCALIDGKTAFDELFALNGALKYVRITGLDLEGDGSDLKRWYDAGLGGFDSDGNTVNGKCKLVGTYRLTTYLDDATHAKYADRFDELNIRQPEYTMIEFDDTVEDDANVSNPDNKTGYKYGNDYRPSGHIEALLKKRHRVLAKVTKKPTTQAVKIANVDTIMNNLDGVMTYYPLHDRNSNYYADAEDLEHCTPAKLDGTEGDFGIIEPHRWTKGINDYLNGKHYSCFSSNEDRPSIPEATVIGWGEIQGKREFRKGYKIATGRADLESSFSADSNYSACCVEVDGYKKVRFPSVPGTNMTGSIFVDGNGAILKNITLQTLSNKFEAGMYLISDVPEGATHLYFSILNTAEFDKVVLSNSDKIEDMEPDWVEEDETFVAAVGSSVVGDKLRACITGGSTASNMPWGDFHYYSVARGMQQIDPLMHNWIANLFYAKYGRRDSQSQCGAGSHTNNRKTGGTVETGMTDTIGFDAAKAIDDSLTPSLVDGLNPQYAWYSTTDEWGNPTVKRVDNTCCLGYEDIYGHKYDMMDRVDLPNGSGNQYKWRIWMPDGTIRMVKGKSASDQYITAVFHGKHMDVIPVGNVAGSYTTHYGDKYWINGSAFRVVYRGYYYAYAHGGVSNAYAYYDASYAYTSVGSRLAFRGKIVKASSVSAYKALIEAA